MRKPVEERVAAGVAFMDQLLPQGWQERIRTHDLNIALDETCVLGQCCGSFSRTTRQLGMLPAEARELGFFEFQGKHQAQRYRRLTNAWKREINKQRELVAA